MLVDKETESPMVSSSLELNFFGNNHVFNSNFNIQRMEDVYERQAFNW